MRSQYWDFIRMSRSNLLGQAVEGSARELDCAALQQFEDLMRAAEHTGYASRPLPLFYALSQAGKALEALAGVAPARYHGLGFETSEDSVLMTLVDPKGDGRFQSVSKCVGSPPLNATAQLGALVASLPGLATYVPPGDERNWPHPVEVQEAPVEGPGAYLRGPNWNHYNLVFREEIESAEAVGTMLAQFPGLKGRWMHPYRSGQFLPQVQTVPGVGTVCPVLLKDNAEGISGIACAYREQFFVRPAVADGGPPPIPLMTWWLVSYGLSMLARYNPREWVRALDVDTSIDAVVLEHCMDEALTILPELIAMAILDAGGVGSHPASQGVDGQSTKLNDSSFP